MTCSRPRQAPLELGHGAPCRGRRSESGWLLDASVYPVGRWVELPVYGRPQSRCRGGPERGYTSARASQSTEVVSCSQHGPLSAASVAPAPSGRKPIERRRSALMRRYELMLLLPAGPGGRQAPGGGREGDPRHRQRRWQPDQGLAVGQAPPGLRHPALPRGQLLPASTSISRRPQVREIERGLLITEEILRHLVTVLEDHGPADEIAPAVAQRATSELDEADEPIGADGAIEADDVDARRPMLSANEPGDAIRRARA